MSRLISTAALAAVFAVAVGAEQRETPVAGRGLRVEVTVPPAIRGEPVTGRGYVMVARANDREPRLQIGRTGTPFFGRDVDMLPPGRATVLDASDHGTPVASMKDLPPGDYWVQGFVNVHSEFKRADGHTVWRHDDQWEGHTGTSHLEISTASTTCPPASRARG